MPAFSTLRLLAATGVLHADSVEIDDAARSAGWRVDSTPAVGALGVFERGERGAGRQGHVFYVARVYSTDGRLLIEQYNWAGRGEYSTLELPADWARSYMHLGRLAKPARHAHSLLR